MAGAVAVILLAHGAVDDLADLPRYLTSVMGGRAVPEAILDEVMQRYREIGGRSPLIDITQAQADALQRCLNDGDGPFRVSIGMRHSAPTIAAAVEAAVLGGAQTLVAVPMTPYYSKMSVGAYLRVFDAALGESGKSLSVRRVEGWHDEPLLVAAFAENIKRACEDLFEPVLLLTAHSLPERILAEGDPYDRVLKETAAAVARAAGFKRWRFAYQSKGGAGAGAWLGPEAGDVLRELARAGAKSVVLSPIGFVSDHMETLYDDDILYRGVAQQEGMRFARAAAPNADPTFIKALAQVVRRALGTS